MAYGRRCDNGCQSWPNDDRYSTCPLCGEATTCFSNLSPLTLSEALHVEFEVFYAEWDDTRDPARLDPRVEGVLSPSG